MKLRAIRGQFAAPATFAGIAVLSALFLTEGILAAPSDGTAAKFAEQIVHVETEDDISDAGALFAPPENLAKPIAVIWIHGWGVNFYQPSYVAVCRALANRGYTTISANTRMHDIGNVEAWRGDKRVRGGGYWGVTSEQVRDIAAWVDFAAKRGFKVVLVGHSAGWEAVLRYQVQKEDQRVVGLVSASGGVRPWWTEPDKDQLAQANRMVAEGRPDDLVRIPNRPFPSFISAATFLDLVDAAPEFRDFFGVQTPNPAIARVRCPLLAFFGTDGDVGDEDDLKLLVSSVKRQPTGPARVNTALVQGAGHMYTGKEQQVANTIASWADDLLPATKTKGEVPAKP